MTKAGSADVLDQRISINLTPREGREFVERLARDDEFRQRLAEDPRETLARHNIHAPKGVFPDEIELPPKQELQDLLDRVNAGEEVELSSSVGVGAVGLLFDCRLIWLGW